MLIRTLTFLGLCACSPLARAQAPLTDTLFFDVNQGASTVINDGNPVGMAEAGSLLYFAGTGPAQGHFPWVTDGTESGTLPLSTLAGGPVLTNTYDGLALPNGKVLFASASQGDQGNLFVAGPGIAGVELVKQINPSGTSSPAPLTLWNGEAWFYATNFTEGRELWRSDGTEAGTTLGADVNPGPGGCSNGTNTMLVAAGKLFFTTTYPVRGVWVLDAPGGSPVLLAEADTTSISLSTQMAEVGGALLFSLETAAEGKELWRSDGTPAGTTLVADIQVGTGDSEPRFVASDGTTLYFSAFKAGLGRELWKSDGTTAGTQLVVESIPGANGLGFSLDGVIFQGGLLYGAPFGVSGNELVFTDGTAAGTTLLADIAVGPDSSAPGSFAVVGNTAYFRATTPATGSELWKTNGTGQGTRLVADIRPGPEPSYPYFVGTTPAGPVFSADNGPLGYEPWLTDGTPAGTQLLKNLYPDPLSASSYPSNLRRFQDKLLFSATVEGLGSEPWVTDGTPSGTQLLGDFYPGPENSYSFFLGEVGGRLIFSARSETAVHVYATDGTPGNEALLLSLLPGSSLVGPGDGPYLDGSLVFAARVAGEYEFYRTDGTPAGTYETPDIFQTGYGLDLWSVVLDGSVLFAKEMDQASGDELWKTDGTVAGTVLVADINPGPSNSNPWYWRALGDGAVFFATAPATGTELYFTDGTTAGTLLLKDILPGPDSTTAVPGAVLGDRMLFAADDGVHGREVWSTDGTPAGTQMLIDLVVGPDGSFPISFVQAGERVFFYALAPDGTTGLWKTDGTALGTTFVQSEAAAGVDFWSWKIEPLASSEHVLFLVDTPETGIEFWISDGSAAGTQLLTDTWPGPETGFALYPARLGDRLFFSGNDGAAGAELHAFTLANAGAFALEPFGQSCGASIDASGEARVGASFDVEVETGAAATPVLLFYGQPSWIPLSPDCSLHVGVPTFFGSSIAGADGVAVTPFGVPADPALVGAQLALQAAAVTVGGPYLDLLALTEGLEIVVGP